MMVKNKTIASLLGCLIALSQTACTLVSSGNQSGNNNVRASEALAAHASTIERICDMPMHDEGCPDGLQFINERVGWLFCNSTLWRTEDGGRSWERVYSDSNAMDRPSSFRFVDAQIGWNSSVGTIQKSEDGGRSWKPLATPLDGTNGEISSLTFLTDGKQGWIAGATYSALIPGAPENEGLKHIYQNTGKAPRGIIFHTSDGGLTWNQQFVSPKLGSFIYSVYASDDLHIWALSETTLYELDGTTWRPIDFERGSCVKRQLLDVTGLNRRHHDIYEIMALSFTGPTGWLSFRNGYVAKSLDGGEAWCDLAKPTNIQSRGGQPSFFTKFYFADSSKGWALGSNHILYQTDDGGATWSKFSEIKISTIFFLDDNHIWAANNESIFRIAR